jgi:signal transduction histidine kinase
VAPSVEYFRCVGRLSRLARAYGFDLLILIAAATCALEVALRHDSRAPTTTTWFAAPAIAFVILPLLARRRFPFAAPAAVWLLAASLSFVDGRLVPFTASATVAGLAAAFLLGHLSDTTQARLGLAIVIGATAIIVYNDPDHAAGELIFTPALFAIGWVAGFALRARGEQVEVAEARAKEAEREREVAVRIAAAEERTRIARELHDIVAHAVSVMVLQVGSVRHQLPEARAEDREALEGVEKTGRTALAEMRRLLGAMRRDGDEVELAPQPGLDNLDALIAQVARAGLAVDLQFDGEPFPLPLALDLSAYRIVQEGLTNALKHAHASRAEVAINYGVEELQIEVRNDGNGGATDEGERDGLGFGLAGIRERVKIYGGEMSARALGDGGFVLTTRLPLEGKGR